MQGRTQEQGTDPSSSSCHLGCPPLTPVCLRVADDQVLDANCQVLLPNDGKLQVLHCESHTLEQDNLTVLDILEPEADLRGHFFKSHRLTKEGVQ